MQYVLFIVFFLRTVLLTLAFENSLASENVYDTCFDC